MSENSSKQSALERLRLFIAKRILGVLDFIAENALVQEEELVATNHTQTFIYVVQMVKGESVKTITVDSDSPLSNEGVAARIGEYLKVGYKVIRIQSFDDFFGLGLGGK